VGNYSRNRNLQSMSSSQGSSVSIVTRLQCGRSGVRISTEPTDFTPKKEINK
jgi:hypothetical protein